MAPSCTGYGSRLRLLKVSTPCNSDYLHYQVN